MSLCQKLEFLVSTCLIQNAEPPEAFRLCKVDLDSEAANFFLSFGLNFTLRVIRRNVLEVGPTKAWFFHESRSGLFFQVVMNLTTT